MVLQEKMEAVEEGLDSGHLRVLRFLLPTFQEALISWDLWGYEETESTCGALGVEDVVWHCPQLPLMAQGHPHSCPGAEGQTVSAAGDLLQSPCVPPVLSQVPLP